MVDVGLLILRIFVGLLIAAHGAQKVFGWFGGGGIPGTQKMIRSFDVHPSVFWAWVSALDEFVGGPLLALGFLMPLGPLMIIANMLFAVHRVHLGKGFWNSKGGIEFPLLLLVNALALGLVGAGLYSIDALIHFVAPEPMIMIIGVIIVLIGYIGLLFTSRVQARVHGSAQGSHP